MEVVYTGKPEDVDKFNELARRYGYSSNRPTKQFVEMVLENINANIGWYQGQLDRVSHDTEFGKRMLASKAKCEDDYKNIEVFLDKFPEDLKWGDRFVSKKEESMTDKTEATTSASISGAIGQKQFTVPFKVKTAVTSENAKEVLDELLEAKNPAEFGKTYGYTFDDGYDVARDQYAKGQPFSAADMEGCTDEFRKGWEAGWYDAMEEDNPNNGSSALTNDDVNKIYQSQKMHNSVTYTEPVGVGYDGNGKNFVTEDNYTKEDINVARADYITLKHTYNLSNEEMKARYPELYEMLKDDNIVKEGK